VNGELTTTHHAFQTSGDSVTNTSQTLWFQLTLAIASTSRLTKWQSRKTASTWDSTVCLLRPPKSAMSLKLNQDQDLSFRSSAYFPNIDSVAKCVAAVSGSHLRCRSGTSPGCSYLIIKSDAQITCRCDLIGTSVQEGLCYEHLVPKFSSSLLIEPPAMLQHQAPLRMRDLDAALIRLSGQ